MELYCTICPNQCLMQICVVNEADMTISGNRCSRGMDFAHQELTCPIRVLTTTVLVEDGNNTRLIPVRSRKEIPLKEHMKIMGILKKMKIGHKVGKGMVVLADAAGTGEDMIACVPSDVCRPLYMDIRKELLKSMMDGTSEK